MVFFFFFSSRRRHTRCSRDWSSDVCSSDLGEQRDREGEVERWVAPGGADHSADDQLDHQADVVRRGRGEADVAALDRKSTRLNSSHGYISYAVFCLKKKKKQNSAHTILINQ